VVTITLVLYTYFSLFKPISMTGWLLCLQDILMLWAGSITFTSLPLFHCDENMQPPDAKTKTDHCSTNKFSVSVWVVKKCTLIKNCETKTVRDWWAHLNFSNHVC
jgi:hypothetical protein